MTKCNDKNKREFVQVYLLYVCAIFVVVFFITNFAYAESIGITSNLDDLVVDINDQVNFVISTAQDPIGATIGTYITVSDDGGGQFYTGTIAGACNAVNPDPDNRFAITNNKGVCYSNSTSGSYQIVVSLFNSNDQQIGEPINLSVAVNDPAPNILINQFLTVHNSNYSGVSVQFEIENSGNLSDVSLVNVELFQGDNLLVTNSAKSALLTAITNGQSSFENVFFINEGSMTRSGDDMWLHPLFQYDESTIPTKAVVNIQDADNTYSSTVNNLDESVVTYLEIINDLNSENQSQSVQVGGGAIMSSIQKTMVLGVSAVNSDSSDSNVVKDESPYIDDNHLDPKIQVLKNIFQSDYSIEVKVNLIRVYKTFIIRHDENSISQY